MRTLLLTLMVALAPRLAGAEEPTLPRSVAEAQALLDRFDADLAAYRADELAVAAAPDAIRQAEAAIAEARERLARLGVEGADLELRRAAALLVLIAELVEARALERAADAIAERVVEALERVAVARAAWERITEQLQLFAIPMPGEGGQ
ncbi:MAG: hypothetical protein GYA57_01350 [Myxococcales bacterium]|nr:hypothetical protein [Myxococcales bacterium]